LGAFFIVTGLTWDIPCCSFLPAASYNIALLFFTRVLAWVSPILMGQKPWNDWCGMGSALAQPITCDVYDKTESSHSFSTFTQL